MCRESAYPPIFHCLWISVDARPCCHCCCCCCWEVMESTDNITFACSTEHFRSFYPSDFSLFQCHSHWWTLKAEVSLFCLGEYPFVHRSSSWWETPGRRWNSVCWSREKQLKWFWNSRAEIIFMEKVERKIVCICTQTIDKFRIRREVTHIQLADEPIFFSLQRYRFLFDGTIKFFQKYS